MSRRGLTSFVDKCTSGFCCEGLFFNGDLGRSVAEGVERGEPFGDVDFVLVLWIACFDNLETFGLLELRCLVVGLL